MYRNHSEDRSSILQEQKYLLTTSKLHILLHQITELNSKVVNIKTKLKLRTGVGNEFLCFKCGKNIKLRNLKSRKIPYIPAHKMHFFPKNVT